MREAAYIPLARSGELATRAKEALRRLGECRMCPHECAVDRLAGQTGRCGTARLACVASYGPHFGEESVLVGRYGSGTIFLANCNLSCIFCQNADISQGGHGTATPSERIVEMMVHLRGRHCHNLNFVTPTHVVPQILEALVGAVGHGLSAPLVYNCGGYESVETLRLLDGVVDIYMPDAKYADAAVASRLSGCEGYPEAMRAALKEMHRQVGDLAIDGGVAARGLLVRHLVLPNGLAGTGQTMRFIAEEISRDTYVNIMAQYRPMHRARECPQITSMVTHDEMAEAYRLARSYGLHRFAD